jgi:hypothetical protein
VPCHEYSPVIIEPCPTSVFPEMLLLLIHAVLNIF